MNDHYFTQQPQVKHDEKYISVRFFDKNFIFKTDAGVFSKDRVDFGSTLLIESFEIPKEGKILDLGCGYGPIGISISSQMQAGEVILADINERAINLAIENAKKNSNHINQQVKLTIIQSDGFEKIEDTNFDYILLNPPIRTGKLSIYKMFREAYEYLNKDGELWIVIQKKQGAPSAIKELESIFSKVEEVERSKGYHIIKSLKI